MASSRRRDAVDGAVGASTRPAQVCGEMFYYLAHSGFSQWSRPKIPHQSLERVLEPFHLEDEVVFRFPGRVKPEHAKVIRVRKDQDTGERMYDVEPEDEKQRMKTPVHLRVLKCYGAFTSLTSLT